MSVIYNATLKNTRMQDVVTAVDVSAPGTLVIFETDGTTVLATITLNSTFGTVSGGVLTVSGTPLSATAVATGTAAKASVKDGAGTVVISGLTVGVSASDINLSSVAITSGDTVTITSGSITHG